jgi:hypothetical protein
MLRPAILKINGIPELREAVGRFSCRHGARVVTNLQFKR